MLEVLVFEAGRLPRQVLVPAVVLALASAVLATLLVGEVLAVRAVGADPRAAPGTTATGGAAPDATSSTAPNASLAGLADSELFGHYDPSGVANAAKGGDDDTAKPARPVAGTLPPADLPEATLAVKLQGILYQSDPAARRALFAGDGPRAEPRRIGDALAGGATIRFIEPRRVVVEVQGELRALNLVEPAPTTVGGFAAPSGGVPAAMQTLHRGAIAPPPEAYVEPPLDEPAVEEPAADDPSATDTDAGAEQYDGGSETYEEPEPAVEDDGSGAQ